MHFLGHSVILGLYEFEANVLSTLNENEPNTWHNLSPQLIVRVTNYLCGTTADQLGVIILIRQPGVTVLS